MNQKLAFILFAFAFVVVLVVGFGRDEDPKPAPAEFRAKVQETLLKPRRPGDPTKSRPPVERNPSSTRLDPLHQTDPLKREDFLRKYGENLQLTDHEGRVVRVEGAGISKNSGFRPSSAVEVSARAREVFDDVRALLGISDESEFILHPPTTGESSAQVVLQQSEGGVPLSPGGLVTLLFGSDGEILGIDSSIYPKTEVVNQASLGRAESSRAILYVTQSAPTAILRHAYETRERGIQKVVDAETGTVLLERDRRVR